MTIERRKVVCPHCNEPFYTKIEVSTDIMITDVEMVKDSSTELSYENGDYE